jgi:hypothetical protein
VGVGPRPIGKRAARAAEDALDDVEDDRVVEFALGIEAEERLDDRCGRVRAIRVRAASSDSGS